MATLVTMLAGCAAGGSEAADGLSGDLLVFGAASLTDVLQDAAAEFERTHPGVDVHVNLAGSQRLAAQIAAGAAADVFVSASPSQMEFLAEAGLVAGQPETVARNRLAIAVEPGNPRGVEGLGDLRQPDAVVVLADGDVPAGDYAAQVLDRADVDVEPVSLEVDARAVLAKVALGEADAGIVYATDVAATEAVDGVAIPDDVNADVAYPAAVLSGSDQPAAARAFLDFVLSQRGQGIFAERGFAGP